MRILVIEDEPTLGAYIKRGIEEQRWACDLVAQLTDRQWHDLFAAAGYEPRVAERFIAALKKRIDEGRHIEPAATGR